MQVFYDPADNNQVQAVYTGNTTSIAWGAFTKIAVTDPARISEILLNGRNCRLTVVDGVVTVVTPFNHPADFTLAANKIRRKAEVDDKSERLERDRVKNTGQGLHNQIDNAPSQTALDAITDNRT